ncbi:hypothetical protein O181_034730 [Austropuccinia psidii MF-1]|uniref:Uncharacterized protein n=1 Tax=Austropuccinia psidii MF-1 TaxID=1389203 RepID=A0A9Q3D3I8_9BASI|nr:hypothetical protein [Austropuccinia psidii MF-1]
MPCCHKGGKNPSQLVLTASQASTNTWPIGHIINPRPTDHSWCGMALWPYPLHMVTHDPRPQLWPLGHILLHWPFWPIPNLTNPPTNTSKFGPGGHSAFQGPLTHPL